MAANIEIDGVRIAQGPENVTPSTIFEVVRENAERLVGDIDPSRLITENRGQLRVETGMTNADFHGQNGYHHISGRAARAAIHGIELARKVVPEETSGEPRVVEFYALAGRTQEIIGEKDVEVRIAVVKLSDDTKDFSVRVVGHTDFQYLSYLKNLK